MALHSEIKVNYYVLSDIAASLKEYEQALTDMQTSLSNIDRVIAESEGKAFDALRKIEHNFDGEIETCRQEIKDVYTSIENYIRDMSAIISDVPPGSTVLVDRNDIYWNLQSIKEACREIGRAELDTVYRTVQYEDPSELVQIKEDERRGEAMRAEIRKTSEEIDGYCRALEEIYRTDVCSFEDMDDEHAQKMSALHAKYTSQKEGWREIGKLGADFVKGAFDDVKALATGIRDIPQIPKALKGMTPETFVEQLCQGASDAVAEKGYAYGSGYAAAEIGVSVLATKGLDKIGKGVKTLKGTKDIGKDLKRVIKPGDMKKPGKLVPDVEDDVARIGKPGVIESSYGKSSGKSGADNIADAAKLKEYYKQAEKYGTGSIKELGNGRFRFYEELKPARTQGEMAGARHVREWDTYTGLKRDWYETLDYNGIIRQVRPDPNITGGVKVHYMFDAEGNYIGNWIPKK